MSKSKPTCGAKTVAGPPCKNPPMANGRCKFHGGALPAPGPSHPNYKHGRYSKLRIPDDLQDRINAEMVDEELLSLRRDIATLRVRLTELLANIGSSANPATLQQLLELASAAEEAHDSSETDECGKALRRLRRVIVKAMAPENAWKEVERLTERLRKLVATERDLAHKLGQLIPVNVLVFMADKMMSVHAAHSSEPHVVAAMRREFAQLVGSYRTEKVIEVENAPPEVSDPAPGG